MTEKVETTVTITHLGSHGRVQRIEVKSPVGNRLLLVEAPAKTALRTLAEYMRTWSNQGEDGRVRE